MSAFEHSSYPEVAKLTIPDVSVAALDMGCLPPVLKRFVEDGAMRMQAPVDFIVVAALCSVGAAIGTSIRVQPKAMDTRYQIVPTLWGAIIGDPSSMKSPSISFALNPIQSLEGEMRIGHKNAELEYKANKKIFDMKLKQVEAGLATGSKKGVGEAAYADLALMLESEPEQPTEPRLVVNDSTVPKLGVLMNQNPRGLILVRDELAGWLAGMQGETAGVDRAFYLEAYNGTGSYTYDRISRDKVHIERCCLSVLGGIQPSKLKPLVSDAISGKEDDGFLQRLQLAVWPAKNKTRTYVDRTFDEQAELQFKRSLRSLLSGSPDDPKVLRFSCEAQMLFQIWWENLQQELANVDSELFQAFKIKQEKTICSIACIFELLESPSSGDISKNSFEKASVFVRYLETHAKKIYRLDENPELSSAMLLCARRRKINEEFTARELQRKGWPGLKTAQQVRLTLECLEEHGYLISAIGITTPSVGNQAKKTYAWNPNLKETDLIFDN
ncbi:YfjI family protein [Oleiphilus sp. HI0125]|uniref:YfjI family protein n=2 Tax=Oleiphilus sp. HI0125 TaxID=1822266 RepID=UPI000A42E2BF|nr:YfjI family protein [Oleiphilus sp. HI0125]